jgi:hypothetical protein
MLSFFSSRFYHCCWPPCYCVRHCFCCRHCCCRRSYCCWRSCSCWRTCCCYLLASMLIMVSLFYLGPLHAELYYETYKTIGLRLLDCIFPLSDDRNIEFRTSELKTLSDIGSSPQSKPQSIGLSSIGPGLSKNYRLSSSAPIITVLFSR